MSRLRVAPIVEGDGEYHCVRILLERIWYELLGGEYIKVVRPTRHPSGQLLKPDGMRNAVRLAVDNLNDPPVTGDPGLVLILIDADEKCPGRLGPELLAIAREANSAVDVACALANLEYETWFVGAAESLSKYLNLSSTPVMTELPEAARHKKAWVEQRFRRGKYSETQDQPRLTREMDLALCRKRSPSFDKLCRELERRLRKES
jgi:hypothetical protein